MIDKYLEQRAQLDRQVVERAMQDTGFRQALIENPRGTLETTYGITVPESADIRVIEETGSGHTFVLPPFQASGDELTEEALEAVAGGWYVNLIWSSICFGSGEGGPSNADITVAAA